MEKLFIPEQAKLGAGAGDDPESESLKLF